MIRPIARTARAAFTLVEMLAVILIIGILMTFLIPKALEAVEEAKVTGCKKNLQEIYSGFTLYQTKFQHLPDKSGVRFFAELIALGVWEDTAKSAERLNCPAVQKPIGPGEMPKAQWYTNLDQLDGTWSSYAGRNSKEFPLKRFSGKEVLVADDNDGAEMNHPTATVALYGDGTAQTFELKLLQQEGKLGPDEILIVGPESQIEDLRKLSLD